MDGRSLYKGNFAITTITAATATLTPEAHAGHLIVVNRAAGSTLTLPDATGSGAVYTIVTVNDQTGDLVIQAPDGDNVMQGVAKIGMDGETFAAAATSDTITLNGSTTSGLAGTEVTLRDVAADTWQVLIIGEASGTEATPFSAAVA